MAQEALPAAVDSDVDMGAQGLEPQIGSVYSDMSWLCTAGVG